jgi:hypothetical protein
MSAYDFKFFGCPIEEKINTKLIQLATVKILTNLKVCSESSIRISALILKFVLKAA